MPRYTMDQATFQRLDALTPERIAFGYEDEGVWVHDSEAAARWDMDPDVVFASEGGYAAVLASLDNDGTHLLISEYADMDDDPYTPPKGPWDPRAMERMNLSRVPIAWGSRGEVVAYRFYPIEEDGTVREDLVAIEETHEWAWDTLQPLHRKDTGTFYRVNGEAHPTTRTRRKRYNTAKKVAEEGKTRRGALIDRCFGTVYGWAGAGGMGGANPLADIDTVKAFGAALSEEIDGFINLSLDALRPAISVATDTWLDFDLSPGLTVRAFLLSTLDIGFAP